MTPARPPWTLHDLQAHLQAAVDLEFWTIPFYMSAMYSIRDNIAPAYPLIQAVVYQEMLHLQLAANVANAYGTELRISPPIYAGKHIPHLDFALDHPDPRPRFEPYTAEIGPLDLARVNAMCLIEYPEWGDHRPLQMQPKIEEYGSIGAFYRAVELGMRELAAHLHAGRNQVDHFSRYYQNIDRLTVDQRGEAGLSQALRLIQMITTQGEGEFRGERDVPTMFQNTADDAQAKLCHFSKFQKVRASIKEGHGPETYSGEPHPPPGSAGHRAQEILLRHFRALCEALQGLLRGRDPAEFVPCMVKVGAAIANCWQSGAIPRFTEKA